MNNQKDSSGEIFNLELHFLELIHDIVINLTHQRIANLLRADKKESWAFWYCSITCIDYLLESLWRQKLAYAAKMELEEIAAASVEGLVPGNLYDVNQSLSGALESMLDRRYCADCIMVNEDVESQVEKLKSTLGAKRFKVFTVFHLLLRLYRLAEHVRNRSSTSLPLLLVDNACRHWVFVYRILRLDDMCQQRILDRWLGDISEPTLSRQHSSEVCEHLRQTLSYLLADEEGSYITTAEEPAYRERFQNVLMSFLERNNNNQESVSSEPTTESFPITVCECDTNGTSYITVKQILDTYFTHCSDADTESQSDNQVEVKPIPPRVVSLEISTQIVSPVDSEAKDLVTGEQEVAIELQQSPRKITTELTATRRSPRKNAAISVSPQLVKSSDTPRPRIREGTPLSEGSPVPVLTTEPIVTKKSPLKNTAILPLSPQPVKSPNKLRPRIREGTPQSEGYPVPVPTSSNTKQKESARKSSTATTSRTSRQRNASVTSKLAALVKRRKVKQTQVRHTWKRGEPSINTAKLTIKQLNERSRSTRLSPKKNMSKSKTTSQNSRIDPTSKRNIRRIATVLDAVILDEVLNEPTRNAEASDGRRTRSRNTNRSSPRHTGTGDQTATADLSERFIGSKRASSEITTRKRSQTLNVSNNATVGSTTDSSKFNRSSLSTQSCSPRLDRSCHSNQSTSHTRARSVSPADVTLETGEFLQMIVTAGGESFSRSPANHRSPGRHDSSLANHSSPASHRALASQRISSGGRSRAGNMSLTRSRSPASHKSQVNRRSTAHERSLSRNRSQASPKTPASNRSPASHKSPMIYQSSAYQSLPASHSSATSSRLPASHQTPASKRTRSPASHTGEVMTPDNDSGRTTRQSKTHDHNQNRSAGDIRRRKSLNMTALVGDNTGISFLSASSQPVVDSSPNRASADVRSDVAADTTSYVAVFGKGYKWTVEEDRALYRLIVQYTRSKREIDFEEVSKALPHRSADSLRNHWVRLRKRKSYMQYTVKVGDDSVQKSISTPSVSKPARSVRSAVVACMTQSSTATPSEVTLSDVVSVGATPEVLAEEPMSEEVTATEVTTADHMSADVTTQGSKGTNKWSLQDDIKLYRIITHSQKNAIDFSKLKKEFPFRSADSIRNHWAALRKKKTYLHKHIRPALKTGDS